MSITNLLTPSGVTLFVAYIVGIVALKLFVFSHTGNRASWLIFTLFCANYGVSNSNILVVFGCAVAMVLFAYLFLSDAANHSSFDKHCIMWAFIIIIFEVVLVGGFSWITSFRSFVHELSNVLLVLGFLPLIRDAARKPYRNSSGFIWMSLGSSLLWLIGQSMHPHLSVMAYVPPVITVAGVCIIIFIAERNSIYDPLQEKNEKPTLLDRMQADLFF